MANSGSLQREWIDKLVAGASEGRDLRARHLRQFAALSVALALAAAAALLLYEQVSFAIDRAQAEISERVKLQRADRIARRSLAAVAADLRTLAQSENLARLINTEWSLLNWTYVAKEFVVEAREKGIYDQIRFIDKIGTEFVRVDYEDGSPTIVALEDLQGKGHRYYFREAIKLEKGGLYVSPLDLNVEHGNIQVPHKPVIRVAVPVFDGRGRKAGILIVNYLAEILLRDIAEALGEAGFLLNSDGYRLLGGPAEGLWGFMFGGGDTFGQRNPQAWERMIGQGEGREKTPDGEYLYQHIHGLLDIPGADPSLVEGWYFMALLRLPDVGLVNIRAKHIPLIGALYLLLITLSTIGAWHLTKGWTQRKQTEITLRRLSRAVEQSPVSVIISSPDGRIEYVNPMAVETSGFRRDELLGQPIDLVTATHGDIRVALHSGQEWRGEVQGDCRGDRCKWESVLVSPVRNAEGAIQHMLTIKEDVTRQKEAAEALALSEQKYRQLMENATDAIIMVNAFTEKVVEANKRAGHLFGVPREQMIGMMYTDLDQCRGTAASQGKSWIEDAVQSVIPHVVEMDIPLPGGSHIASEVRSVSAYAGGHRFVQVILRDVTERRRAEDEIRALAEFPNQNPSPVLRVSTDGAILYANAQSDHLLHAWETGIGSVVPEGIRDLILEVIDRDEMKEVEIELEEHVYSLLVAPISERGYVNIYGRDITEARGAERRLRQAQKMEAIGTMAGGIAHDFNNILTAIIGYAHLLSEDLPEGSQVRDDAVRILKGADRAKALVRQILTFSRGQIEERHLVDVRILVEEALDLLRASIPSSVDMQVEMPEGNWEVLADPSEIHQMVMNLCLNASDSMGGSPGSIRVALANVTPGAGDVGILPSLRATACVRLTISDTGSGMDEATRERIFDPFFTTKEVGRGTGMGLAVVHGIVGKLNGDISVRSRPGQGTTFEILIPLSSEKNQVLNETTLRARTGKERILLVDDEADLIDIQERGLKRLGYQVVSATSSEIALGLIRREAHRFDLMVTDLTMPKMTGLGLAAAVYAIAPTLPVILCSGNMVSLDDDAVKSTGIRLFLQKPFSPEELAAQISQILRAEKAGRGTEPR